MEHIDDDNDDDSMPGNPIDEAFWAEWIRIGPGVLNWAEWFFNDLQLAQERVDDAFDRTASGRVKWRVGKTLDKHMRQLVRRIHDDAKKKLSELVLEKPNRNVAPNKAVAKEDRDPGAFYEAPLDDERRLLLHNETPEERYIDAEGTLIAEQMAEEIFDLTKPGSTERGVLLEARKGNHKTEDVAAALGVTRRQVTRAKESLRLTKVRPVLAKYGFTDPKLLKKAGQS